MVKKAGISARTLVSVAINATVDLEKPVIVRLGLWDNRATYLGTWSSRDGHLMLTLADTPHIEQRSMEESDKVRRALRRREAEALDFGTESGGTSAKPEAPESGEVSS